MKRVSIINSITGQAFGAEFSNDSEMQSWIDMCVDKDYFGRKERTKDTEALTEEEKLITPIGTSTRQVLKSVPRYTGNMIQEVINGSIVEFPEYEFEDVLEDVPQTTLPKEYIITITDLEQDSEYLLEQCYKARKVEYGSLESQLDEIYHDMDAWKSRLTAIKLAIPKP